MPKVKKGEIGLNEDIKQMQELEKLAQDHIVRGGQILEYACENRDAQAIKRAEDCLTEGLTKLKKMKLSPQNRQNIRLLRNAIEFAIKSTKALQKGQYGKAGELMQKASDYGNKYAAAVIARAGGK